MWQHVSLCASAEIPDPGTKHDPFSQDVSFAFHIYSNVCLRWAENIYQGKEITKKKPNTEKTD